MINTLPPYKSHLISHPSDFVCPNHVMPFCFCPFVFVVYPGFAIRLVWGGFIVGGFRYKTVNKYTLEGDI